MPARDRKPYMNYGPLEFAEYLARKGASQNDSAAVKAARAAAPATRPANRLTIVSGSTLLTRVTRAAQVEAVSVYEAVAVHSPRIPRPRGSVTVLVRAHARPVVLVLSSHQTVHWELSTRAGRDTPGRIAVGVRRIHGQRRRRRTVTSIGGFYAFKHGLGRVQASRERSDALHGPTHRAPSAACTPADRSRSAATEARPTPRRGKRLSESAA